MRIPLGRLIWVERGDFFGGQCLWMVTRGPYICELCGGLNMSWFTNIDTGLLTCGVCGLGVSSWHYAMCPVCGEDDWHGLRLVSNNDFGMSIGGDDVRVYNDLVGKKQSVCGNEFDRVNIRRNSLRDSVSRKPEFKVFSAEETLKRKRLLVWSSSDDYRSDVAMPSWVYDLYPDGSQL